MHAPLWVKHEVTLGEEKSILRQKWSTIKGELPSCILLTNSVETHVFETSCSVFNIWFGPEMPGVEPECLCSVTKQPVEFRVPCCCCWPHCWLGTQDTPADRGATTQALVALPSIDLFPSQPGRAASSMLCSSAFSLLVTIPKDRLVCPWNEPLSQAPFLF